MRNTARLPGLSLSPVTGLGSIVSGRCCCWATVCPCPHSGLLCGHSVSSGAQDGVSLDKWLGQTLLASSDLSSTVSSLPRVPSYWLWAASTLWGGASVPGLLLQVQTLLQVGAEHGGRRWLTGAGALGARARVCPAVTSDTFPTVLFPGSKATGESLTEPSVYQG